MKIYNLALVGVGEADDLVNWCTALNKQQEVKYQIIDLTKNDWLNRVKEKKIDYIITRPPWLSSKIKKLFDERIFLIDTILKIPIYPTPSEIYIYEDKQFLYSWLEANNLPHPKTDIFYSEKEAIDFINRTDFPIVTKTSIGASGRGIKLVHTIKEAVEYIKETFSTKGTRKKWGPNLRSGNLIKRALHYFNNPSEIKKKSVIYKNRRLDVQKGFVIFQEYIKHDFEWRIVGIGNSYFAHKKLKKGDKASGSLLKNYDNPPLYLFNFARNVMQSYGFLSQAIDVFENQDGKLLINEMQCMFGQSDPYQMLVNGKPGRYKFFNDNWIFEEGDFARNECFDLRVQHVISILKKSKT